MSTATATTLSTQERAILEGKKTLHAGMSDCIVQMHDAVRSDLTPMQQAEIIARTEESMS